MSFDNKYKVSGFPETIKFAIYIFDIVFEKFETKVPVIFYDSFTLSICTNHRMVAVFLENEGFKIEKI